MATVLRRELRLFGANSLALMQSIFFFIMAATIFHIAVGPYELDHHHAVGIMLAIITLSLFLGSQNLFAHDYNNAMLDQLLISGAGTGVIVISKWLFHTISNTVAFLFVLPIAAISYNFNLEQIIKLLLSSFLCILSVSLISVFTAALTLQKRSSNIMLLVSMPLCIPALILTSLGYNDCNYLLIMLGITIFIAPITIFAAAKSLKIH